MFKQYDGPITAAQAAEGIQAAIRNAKSLIEDAKLLMRESRWPRAAALSILAIEESGKVPIIRSILLAPNQIARKQAWNDYRKHTAKNVIHLIPEMIKNGARRLEDFRPMYLERKEPAIIDTLKQIAFYSDCGTISKWSVPDDVIDENLSKQILWLAEFSARSEAFSSREELEILARHIAPVWGRDVVAMKNALFAAYEEARAKGVLNSTIDPQTLADFLS